MKRALCCALVAAVLTMSAPVLFACDDRDAAPHASYEITAEFLPEGRRLVADMAVTVPNEGEAPLEELKFQLWPNAYREGAKYAPLSSIYASSAYYDGPSYGEINVKGVTGAADFSVCGEDENILSMKLPTPLGQGESATVQIAFEVELAKVDHRLGVGRHTVNLANFYPILCYRTDEFREYVYSSNGDPFVSELADYDVTLTVPSGYEVASGFPLEKRSEENDEKQAYHVRAEGVRDVAFVLGEDLRCIAETCDGVEVRYYYHTDERPENALRAATESLSWFRGTFGEYAYPCYAVVETDFVYGGMEFPALSMISSTLRSSDVPIVIAHETAHQWWYAMVGSNQFENAWQDEGLAEYSAALFLEAHPEYGIGYNDFVAASEASYRAFFSVYSQVNGQANTTMQRPLTQFSGDYEYRNVVYDKGVILFDRLRETLGQKKFLSALKRYASSCSGKIASPEELIACFTHASANAGALFDSFLSGKAVI